MPHAKIFERHFLINETFQRRAATGALAVAADILRPILREWRGGTEPILVLPSARSARAFADHLGEIASSARTCTPGMLPELLLETSSTIAPDVLPQIWASILAEHEKESIRHDNFAESKVRLTSGSTSALVALREELSSAGLECGSLLRNYSSQIPPNVESNLLLIEQLEQRYEAKLRSAKLCDTWMSRREAWEQRRWRQALSPVWLIACAELTPFSQEILREYPADVSVLIASDRGRENAFTDLGVLKGDGDWEPGEFEYQRVDSIWSAADAICDCLPQTNGGRGVSSRSAIGIVNRADRHVITATLRERNIECRDGHGISLSQSSPVLLLDCLVRFAQTRSSEDLLSLLIVLKEHTKLEGVREAAAELDQFIVREVPATILHDSSPGLSIVKPLLKLLSDFYSNKCSIEDFIGEVGACLSGVDDAAQESIEIFEELLPQICNLPETNRAAALKAAIVAVGRRKHEPRGEAPGVELLGWLELYLDESPNIELLNPTSDLIPGPPTNNPFLPEALRREIGLATTHSRANRDRYRWWYITNSNRRVRVIMQASGARGEPLLLSSCLIPIENPSRAAHMIVQPISSTAKPNSISRSSKYGRELPRLELPPPSQVSVTGIGDYLICPYRFALKHLLKLENISDVAHELNAFMFGNILHSVLDRVGKEEVTGRVFKKEKELVDFLENQLERELEFNERRKGGVSIQVESLKARLASYAEWHLNFRAQGWRVEATEAEFKCTAQSGLIVNGRIDRVERNASSGETILLDIKTSEIEKSVDRFHRSSSTKGAWTSLQLPIYRMGWRASSRSLGSIRLGLLFLDGAANVKLHEADWSEDDYQDAHQEFERAAAGISSGVFWPPSDELKLDPYPFVTLLHHHKESV